MTDTTNTVPFSWLNNLKGYATIGAAQRKLRQEQVATFAAVLRTEVIANASGRFIPVAFLDTSNGCHAGAILARRGIFVTDREFA